MDIPVSNLTEAQFQAEMMAGQIAGIALNNPGCIHDMQITLQKQDFFGRWKDKGTCDVQVCFNQDEPRELHTTLPPPRSVMQPAAARDHLANGILAENRHGVDVKNIRKKIRHFIRFYNLLLGPKVAADVQADGVGKTYRFTRNGEPVAVNPTLRALYSDLSTPVLFIFYGADLVTSWKIMQDEIRRFYRLPRGQLADRICGHPVVVAHCHPASVTLWAQMQTRDDRIAKLEEDLRAKGISIPDSAPEVDY